MSEHMSLPSHRELSRILSFAIAGVDTPYNQLKGEVTKSLSQNRKDKTAKENPVYSWEAKAKPGREPTKNGFPPCLGKVDEHGAFYQLG